MDRNLTEVRAVYLGEEFSRLRWWGVDSMYKGPVAGMRLACAENIRTEELEHAGRSL